MYHIFISDIHANILALDAVLEDIRSKYRKYKLYCLGDMINYGPAPNEVVDMLSFQTDLMICGNHESSLFSEVSRSRFSSDRGREALDLTLKELEPRTLTILKSVLDRKYHIVMDGNKSILMSHANPEDNWDYVKTTDFVDPKYKLFDYVVFGHSHKALIRENILVASNETSVAVPVNFMNPGSVGQPRDGDPRASYGVINMNTGEMQLNRVEYDVEKCISMYDNTTYLKNIHPYYKERLRCQES